MAQNIHVNALIDLGHNLESVLHFLSESLWDCLSKCQLPGFSNFVLSLPTGSPLQNGEDQQNGFNTQKNLLQG